MTAQTRIDRVARYWYWTLLITTVGTAFFTSATIKQAATGGLVNLAWYGFVHHMLRNGSGFMRTLVLISNVFCFVTAPVAGVYTAMTLMTAPISNTLALVALGWTLFLNIIGFGTLRNESVKRHFAK
jgi:hypothetical protein